jgi:TolA-binding protein
MEILTKKATQDPPPPVLVRKELPEPVSNLVIAAMARNPDDRPQTMETLEYELNKCLAGRGVAVAQILGMTTDANVVATLNPGLSMRALDDGIVVPRTQTSTPVMTLPRASSHSGMTEMPMSWSSPTMLTGQNNAQFTSRPISEPMAAQSPPGAADSLRMMAMRAGSPADVVALGAMPSQPVQLAPQSRSAIGILGWLLLATLLFGGVGALLYVALGERGARAPVNKLEGTQPVVPESSAPPAETGPRTPTQKPEAPTPGSPAQGSGSDSASLKLDPPANPTQPNKKNPPNKKPTPGGAVDANDPKALQKAANQSFNKGDWDRARELYDKLAQHPAYEGIALYQEAMIAFKTGDNAMAETLFGRAAGKLGGAQKAQAMLLYGDALFRRGEYQRAKDIFVNLRNGSSGGTKQALGKKIIACNKGLISKGVKTTENDGL